MNQRFSKKEHLCSKKHIQLLFSEGSSLYKYPFKLLYYHIQPQQASAVQVLVTVSKKQFKNAVDRNRIKRLIREAYRRNKIVLEKQFEKQDDSLFLGLVYTAKTILSYEEIERKLILILRRLTEQDEETAS